MIGPAIEGLMVTSTVRGAGKTCLMAGLASSLIQQCFTVQAIKPLEVEALNTHRRDYQPLHPSSNTDSNFSSDQAFLNKATRAMQQIDPIWVDIPQQMTPLLWSRVIDICRRTAFPTLIEAPGSIASPLRMENGRHWGAMTWANQLGIPLLLVTPKTTNLIADTAPALAYLLHQLSQQLGGASFPQILSPQFLSAKCIGWVAVESAPHPSPLPYFDEECLFLSQEYRIPFLGTLPFSSRISVPENQAGNLAELVGAEIDLLPVQQALKVFV